MAIRCVGLVIIRGGPPACQDKVAGGRAGVGVVSSSGALLALPAFATAGFLEFFKLERVCCCEFQEFFRPGRALRVTLPTGKGRVVHLFVIYGCQGAEEDSEKLQLTDKLLQAVLAEGQAVCTGQPVLIAGDLYADPAVIPCLANSISGDRFVDLVLAYSCGAGIVPDATCRFSWEGGAGSRRDFLLAVPTRWLRLMLAL